MRAEVEGGGKAGQGVNGTSAVLVTGGAGYIGSHVAWALDDAGRRAVVLDDLSSGRRELAPPDAPFIEGDAGDIGLVARLARDHGCGAVMHFAGSIVVSESVAKPLLYFRNNTAVTGRLIEACLEAGIERFVYSSTAAVYGQPESVPVSEDAPVRPINPYGRSKLMSEWMLADAAAAHRFECVSLRYFNVAGADGGGRTGQDSPAATHLIKIACEAALGRREGVEIYGEDYDTPDGTCIRDYVHVTDLADAHLAALTHLEGGGRLPDPQLRVRQRRLGAPGPGRRRGGRRPAPEPVERAPAPRRRGPPGGRRGAHPRRPRLAPPQRRPRHHRWDGARMGAPPARVLSSWIETIQGVNKPLNI